MIISASRRTDIPAFYSEWFMNRIRAGYCVVPHPFYPSQVYRDLVSLGLGLPDLPGDWAEQVEIEAKYEGYIEKQRREVEKAGRMDERRLPPDLDYEAMSGLRIEARQKLKRFQPATLGQASRLDGVTPADMAVLLVHLERLRATGRWRGMSV